jgi:tetratricopeptide (TPR) repeat protein
MAMLSLKHLNKLILLIAVVAAVLYLTLNNPESATLKLGPSLSISTYAGVLYIGIFLLGCTVASLVALLFGLKGYIRERRLKSRDRARDSFFETIVRARDLMAVGDWGAARSVWEGIVHRIPNNSVALVELSRCVESMGDPCEALRILDTTRQKSSLTPATKVSSELLIQAAKLNLALGNRTAALDNLKLVIKDDPSRAVLEMARDTSESLGLYREALSYHDQLEGLGFRSGGGGGGSGAAESDNIRARLNLKEIVGDGNGQGLNITPASQRTELLQLTKRHPSYIPALERLAELELLIGSRELASEYLLRAARLAKSDIELWRRAVNIWLTPQPASPKVNRATIDRELSERAIRTARTPLKDLHGEARVEGELLLIETLLRVNHLEDAERALDNLSSVIERELGAISTDIIKRIAIQRGHLLAQSGRARETADLWRILAGTPESEATQKSRREQSGCEIDEPSPSLSTP